MAIWNMPSFLSMKCIRDSVVTKWTQCSYLNSDEMSSLLELLSNKDKLWAWCWTRDNVLYIYIVDRLYIQTEESPPVRLPCVSFLKHSQFDFFSWLNRWVGGLVEPQRFINFVCERQWESFYVRAQIIVKDGERDSEWRGESGWCYLGQNQTQRQHMCEQPRVIFGLPFSFSILSSPRCWHSCSTAKPDPILILGASKELKSL